MPIEITMPRLSDTMESGAIIKWNVAAGDSVSSGDVVADIETDKATMELTVFDDGVMARIVVPEGKTGGCGDGDRGDGRGGRRPFGDCIGRRRPRKQRRGGCAGGPQGSDDDAGGSMGSGGSSLRFRRSGAGPQDFGGAMKVSPVARRLAEEYGVDLAQLSGSGRTVASSSAMCWPRRSR
jgi:pyruvate dehydrogenase E2 component (dihydrolipoamide acetyltransferase)